MRCWRREAVAFLVGAMLETEEEMLYILVLLVLER